MQSLVAVKASVRRQPDAVRLITRDGTITGRSEWIRKACRVLVGIFPEVLKIRTRRAL